MWTDEQEWERKWWGNCLNTLDEELKQLVYFQRLGLAEMPSGVPGAIANRRYYFDLQGKSVLDIGGGPCSFLLKCVNVIGTVIDPCKYPDWVYHRYQAAGITWLCRQGEDLRASIADVNEVWIYNVLQHVENPEKVVRNARAVTPLIRFFDWIDTPAMPGHPHTLTEAILNKWLGAAGTVEDINESGAVGRCYYGIFPK